MERIGIGIIAFYKLDELRRGVESVLDHTHANAIVRIHDNSENDAIGEWARLRHQTVQYARSPYNAGCWAARNRLSEAFIRQGIRHFIIQDEDVEWCGDVTKAMLDVFDTYPEGCQTAPPTGVVGWRLAIKQMGGDKPDATGAVRQLPGMCNMYSAECVKAVGGWEASVLMYRMDTLFCLMAGKRGFATRVVPGDGCPIRHNHPHQGIQRYPWWRQEQKRAQGVFAGILAKEDIKWP